MYVYLRVSFKCGFKLHNLRTEMDKNEKNATRVDQVKQKNKGNDKTI